MKLAGGARIRFGKVLAALSAAAEAVNHVRPGSAHGFDSKALQASIDYFNVNPTFLTNFFL
jgi:hypothetical protein